MTAIPETHEHSDTAMISQLAVTEHSNIQASAIIA